MSACVRVSHTIMRWAGDVGYNGGEDGREDGMEGDGESSKVVSAKHARTRR